MQIHKIMTSEASQLCLTMLMFATNHGVSYHLEMLLQHFKITHKIMEEFIINPQCSTFENNSQNFVTMHYQSSMINIRKQFTKLWNNALSILSAQDRFR